MNKLVKCEAFFDSIRIGEVDLKHFHGLMCFLGVKKMFKLLCSKWSGSKGWIGTRRGFQVVCRGYQVEGHALLLIINY